LPAATSSSSSSSSSLPFDTDATIKTSIGVLQYVLDTAKLRAEFRAFCDKEQSSENLACYELVLQYQAGKDVKTRTPIGDTIVEQHLTTNAPYEINLPAKVRQKYMDRFKDTCAEDCFENLMGDLKVVMLDTFARFTRHRLEQKQKSMKQ